MTALPTLASPVSGWSLLEVAGQVKALSPVVLQKRRIFQLKCIFSIQAVRQSADCYCLKVMQFKPCHTAGFGAAKHLSQQGYSVTLLDVSPNPGGLSAGWRTKQGRAVEAGVKGFWYQVHCCTFFQFGSNALPLLLQRAYMHSLTAGFVLILHLLSHLH